MYSCIKPHRSMRNANIYVEPRISQLVFHSVMNLYQFLTESEETGTNTSRSSHQYLILCINMQVAYMRMSHIDKIPPNLLHCAFDSNFSHAWHSFINVE